MTTLLEPYEHFKLCKAKFEELWPEPVVWAYGPNATAQKTALDRVIYIPTENVEFDFVRRSAGANSNFEGVRILAYLRFHVGLKIIAKRTTLFDIVHKVNYVVLTSIAGAVNATPVKAIFPNSDFSAVATHPQELELVYSLPYPLLDPQELQLFTVESAEVKEEDGIS